MWQVLSELFTAERDRQHLDERLVARLRRILDVAEVRRLMPGAQAALDDDPVRQPGVEAEVEPEPVVDTRCCPGTSCSDRPVQVVRRRASFTLKNPVVLMSLGSVCAARRCRRRRNQTTGGC